MRRSRSGTLVPSRPVGRRDGRVAVLGALLVVLVLPCVYTESASAAAGKTVRVSVSGSEHQANRDSKQAVVSGSGRFVVFAADATNLVRRDTNESTDVFLRDLRSGTTRRISVSPSGRQANGDSMQPVVSRDGRVVAYVSRATNLVRRDTNSAIDVFVWSGGRTRRLSMTASGRQANGNSLQPALSADGTAIAFESQASNLISGDTNKRIDVYRRSVPGPAASIERVSVGNADQQARGLSFGPSLSANGDFVAFMSSASNLVAGDANDARDVFVRTADEMTIPISVNSIGDFGNADSVDPAISANGEFIAFASEASNLAPGDGNGKSDVFVHRLATGQTEPVSLRGGGRIVAGASDNPAISADGLTIAFTSNAQLVTGDTNGAGDIFIRDRAQDITRRVSVGRRGEANRGSDDPTLSARGNKIAFTSSATNLVRADTNRADDIFLRVTAA